MTTDESIRSLRERVRIARVIGKGFFRRGHMDMYRWNLEAAQLYLREWRRLRRGLHRPVPRIAFAPAGLGPRTPETAIGE